MPINKCIVIIIIMNKLYYDLLKLLQFEDYRCTILLAVCVARLQAQFLTLCGACCNLGDINPIISQFRTMTMITVDLVKFEVKV